MQVPGEHIQPLICPLVSDLLKRGVAPGDTEILGFLRGPGTAIDPS